MKWTGILKQTNQSHRAAGEKTQKFVSNSNFDGTQQRTCNWFRGRIPYVPAFRMFIALILKRNRALCLNNISKMHTTASKFYEKHKTPKLLVLKKHKIRN